MQRCLLPLVWDLGSHSLLRKEAAYKSLRVVAAVHRVGKWSIGSKAKTEASVMSELNAHLADLLSGSFLYIMSNLLQHEWVHQTASQQEQSARALRGLVGLMKQTDLANLLPKIMIIVDTVLGSGSQRVRLAGVELTQELCDRLPNEVLSANLSGLLVGLYPIVEPNGPTAHVSLAREDWDASGESLMGHKDLSRLGAMRKSGHHDYHYYEPSVYVTDRCAGVGRDMMCVFDAAYSNGVSATIVKKSRHLAIAIIKNIFIQRRRDLAINSLRSVAIIPKVRVRVMG